MNIVQVGDQVVAVCKIEWKGVVIPAGTEGYITEGNGEHLFNVAFRNIAAEAVDYVWVNGASISLASLYWKRRAMAAEAVLDNLASLATYHDGEWLLDGTSTSFIRGIVKRLAKERRGGE